PTRSDVGAGGGRAGAGPAVRPDAAVWEPPAGARRRGDRKVARCRVCGHTLDAAEMKLMRCEDCPSDMDEGLYDRLVEWRARTAAALGQPAFCVFTDKTLIAIAEASPDDERELSRIPGVGRRKFRTYGADVLALCAGQMLEDETDEVAGDA
ncbi:HRDC domain-containing protein, partial [Streptomyces sp. NPDC001904]|uniref:HRDC domain-containing protein n=1 Tax=Streptomyces sp. NPDC001904 TaxID=3154531 RepID=UPI0033197D5A